MAARLFIGYNSALYFWLRGCDGLWSSEPCRATSLAKCAYNVNDVQSFLFPHDAFGPGPLDIMVNDPEKRRIHPSQTCHVWTTPLAEKSFVNIGHDVFVASPALCFLQAANTLSFFDLTELGYELCGSYSRTPGIGNGFVSRQNTLVKPEHIAHLLAKMPHARGYRAAARVIPYIVAGSASPSETDMGLKNHLPPRMGGYGFPLSELNAEIPASEEAWRISGRRKLYPDALWRKQKTCLEYDSTLHHERRDERARDSAKRNALGCMGYKVITVTPDQLQSVDQYHGIAVELARHIGFRLRPASEKTLQKRYELNERIKQRIVNDAKPAEWPYC